MKSERGATLIALIIIVIVLLILGAIAIHLAIKSVDEEIKANSTFPNSVVSSNNFVELDDSSETDSLSSGAESTEGETSNEVVNVEIIPVESPDTDANVEETNDVQ